MEIIFHVVLLNLLPHFDHGVTLGPVPQKPHDVLVHTTSLKCDNQHVNREVIAVTLRQADTVIFQYSYLNVRMAGNMA